MLRSLKNKTSKTNFSFENQFKDSKQQTKSSSKIFLNSFVAANNNNNNNSSSSSSKRIPLLDITLQMNSQLAQENEMLNQQQQQQQQQQQNELKQRDLKTIEQIKTRKALLIR